jgi:hypothetical protein
MTDTSVTLGPVCSDCEKPHPFGLMCPECHEPVVEKPPIRWHWAWGPTPRYSHHPDREPLCPVVGDDGYEPAEPINYHGQDLP